MSQPKDTAPATNDKPVENKEEENIKEEKQDKEKDNKEKNNEKGKEKEKEEDPLTALIKKFLALSDSDKGAPGGGSAGGTPGGAQGSPSQSGPTGQSQNMDPRQFAAEFLKYLEQSHPNFKDKFSKNQIDTAMKAEKDKQKEKQAEKGTPEETKQKEKQAEKGTLEKTKQKEKQVEKGTPEKTRQLKRSASAPQLGQKNKPIDPQQHVNGIRKNLQRSGSTQAANIPNPNSRSVPTVRRSQSQSTIRGG